MASSCDFKVIIVGGGIAGLTLAIALEKFDLDYVLLEAHSTMTPEVGASIGMFPNGLRILDQLGCYEAIQDIPTSSLANTYKRGPDGNVLVLIPGMRTQLEYRHGYGLQFMDRQTLLEIFFKHITHKERLLVNKKVISVDSNEGGASVTCADGSAFHGTLIVGADGVHSSVRSCMRAIVNKMSPGYLDPNEYENTSCYYRCSFGIALNVPGWGQEDQHLVHGRGRSQLVASGPEGRVYWFLFEKLPEVKRGKGIPRYTKEDEAEFVKKNYDVPITDKISFGNVYDHRLTSTLTPLHEFVYKRWFYKRIITIGDSVHKPNPLTGQGGNGAIESCAELINALIRKRDSRGGNLDGLTSDDVEKILKETEMARKDRAELTIQQAHESQAFDAYERPWLSTYVQEYYVPWATSELLLSLWGPRFHKGNRIKALPIPFRHRAIPYADELPARSLSTISTPIWLLYVALMGFALYITDKAWRLDPDGLGVWGANGEPFAIAWFGKSRPTEIINAYASIFTFPLLGGNPEPLMHLVNFLPQLISPIMIYTIEGYRIGHQETILALPFIATVAMQVHGIGRVAPIYAMLSSLFANQLPTARTIPLETAWSLMPAMILAYIIPTALTFAPTSNIRAWQHITALWQLSPILFSVLVWVFSACIRRWRRGNQSVSEYKKKHILDWYKNEDLPVLNLVYAFIFGVQASVHISTLAYAWIHPDISILRAFFSLPNPFVEDWDLSMSDSITVFFRYDMAVAVVVFVCSNLYSIWQLRRDGYIKTSEAVAVARALFVGQVLVGPGAAWAALWCWRENKIARLAYDCGVGHRPGQ